MPSSFDETYLPLPLRKQIVRNDLRLHPIFTLLAEEYGVPLVEADCELEAVIASKVVADALQVRGLWLDFIIFMGPFSWERSPCWSRSPTLSCRVSCLFSLGHRGLRNPVKAT